PGVPAASGAPGVLGAGSSGVVAADVEAAGGVAAAVDEPCGACGDRGLGARATSKTLGPMRAQARLMGLTYAWSSTSSSSYFTVRPAVGTPLRCPSGSNAPPPELPWAILASVLIHCLPPLSKSSPTQPDMRPAVKVMVEPEMPG